ncbi:sialate O-acetylesterase [Zunongwangia endophytica]|uniref:Sialate O-acetylesterase n=1 Tax=Zunongwangia endophytica TaxID=1808945 RepID=A0ABV8H8W1_9FLAO|nr:sialate O-acetylesterase [Zunongwangia endophytica]MDN3594837.1 sialate O-acetylesterase [Zunongwangia endophytica]
MNLFRYILLSTFILLSIQANAQLKLPALFSDNMILQQETEVPIWGWGKNSSEYEVQTSWSDKSYSVKSDKQGKWKLKITTPKAGGPYTINVSNGNDSKTLQNVMIGEVWLCSGQSNMEMPLKGFPGQPVEGGNEEIISSKNSKIRLITIPRDSKIQPKHDFEGNWQEASPKYVGNFSATAWYFGSLLNDVLDIPVGLIHVSYGGSNVEAWMSKKMLEDFDSISIPKEVEDIGEPNRTATALYNGMLAPVINYGIKGTIWYQGESNYDRPFQYKHLFKKMVNAWREEWGQDEFPFYFAQIAPFDYSVFTPDTIVEKYNSAYLREAQLKASKEITNSGIAILTDVGEKDNIHPAQKRKGGQRLAYLALAKTYGLEGFEFESPELNAIEVKENSIIVSFNKVPNGITSHGQKVTGFELAGEDREFHKAKAEVRRKSVVLTSSEVKNPIAVRYLFDDFVEAQLWSNGGLPISSFRTDDW